MKESPAGCWRSHVCSAPVLPAGWSRKRQRKTLRCRAGKPGPAQNSFDHLIGKAGKVARYVCGWPLHGKKAADIDNDGNKQKQEASFRWRTGVRLFPPCLNAVAKNSKGAVHLLCSQAKNTTARQRLYKGRYPQQTGLLAFITDPLVFLLFFFRLC